MRRDFYRGSAIQKFQWLFKASLSLSLYSTLLFEIIFFFFERIKYRLFLFVGPKSKGEGERKRSSSVIFGEFIGEKKI